MMMIMLIFFVEGIVNKKSKTKLALHFLSFNCNIVYVSVS